MSHLRIFFISSECQGYFQVAVFKKKIREENMNSNIVVTLIHYVFFFFSVKCYCGSLLFLRKLLKDQKVYSALVYSLQENMIESFFF